MSNFDKAFEHTIGIEGGYSNHPADRGGPTKYGITLHTLEKFVGQPLTPVAVKQLSLDLAKRIYKEKYWDAWQLDEVDSDLKAMLLFDQCVNWGIGKSIIKRWQNIVGTTQDGIIGPKALGALNDMDAIDFGMRYAFDAQDRYCRLVQRNHSQVVFISGWINRTQELIKLVINEAIK